MKDKKLVPIISMFLFLTVAISGCLDFLPDIPTTYQPHPTHIRYDIKYGYWANVSGTGKYEVNYSCDLPEVLLGTTLYEVLYPYDYRDIVVVNNSMVRWDISGHDEASYKIGLTADIDAESFLVADLNGETALSIQEIKVFYPDIVEGYNHRQSNATMVLIDPYDLEIRKTVDDVLYEAGTNNSFIWAKLLFIWLKENTEYQVHNDVGGVQPASVTLRKGTGDCDDLSFLYISLCRAAGIPARFIRGYLLVEEGDGEASAAAHAWVEVFVGGSIGNKGWIPVECACCAQSIEADIHQNFAVENAFHLRLFVDDGSNESINTSLSGISYVTYNANRYVEVQPFVEVENYRGLESKNLVVAGDNIRFYQ